MKMLKNINEIFLPCQNAPRAAYSINNGRRSAVADMKDKRKSGHLSCVELEEFHSRETGAGGDALRVWCHLQSCRKCRKREEKLAHDDQFLKRIRSVFVPEHTSAIDPFPACKNAEVGLYYGNHTEKGFHHVEAFDHQPQY